MTQPSSKFMIVDGNALLHRAWHALPQTMTSPNGQLTNAAYGFAMILFKAIKELKPTHIAVTFDAKGPTFRDDLYDKYKAQRMVKPQDLYDQIPMIQEILDALGVKYYQISGVEADDVIGSLSRLSSKFKVKSEKLVKTIIVTGDLDTLQLVDENTQVYTLKKGISEGMVYDVEEVKKRYDGLEPAQMIDYKALRGDPSDNIPGAKGIGEKTAIELVKSFKTLENLLTQVRSQDLSKLSKKTGMREAVLQKVRDSLPEVELSQQLATIKQDVKLKFNFDDTVFGQFDPAEVAKVLQKYAFRTLVAQVRVLAEEYGIRNMELGIRSQKSGVRSQGYKLLVEDEVSGFLEELAQQTEFAFDAETDSLDIVSAQPVGISFSWKKGEAYYVEYKRLSSFAKASEDKKPKFYTILKAILEDPQIKKIGHNLKFDYQVLKNAGIEVNNLYFDTMIAAYLINSGIRQYSLDGLVFQYFGVTMQKIEELIGPKGQGQLNMGQVSPEKVADYSGEDADYTWQLYQKLAPEIKAKNLSQVMFEIEMPCVPILGDMEQAGIKLDPTVLAKLGQEARAKVKLLETKIFKLAGQEFNINSPLQLKEILFDKLAIKTKGIRKTKTGISTAAPELEKLRGAHPIIEFIFKHRELAKLLSTYIEALPALVNKRTSRIHTSFNQVVTATGRLSSSNPNMQNIPIRTPLGREIRRAFVAEGGYQLLSLDYSQIDLRMAAHLSGDAKMIATFKADEDIHTSTAAQLFGIKMSEVTKEQRRKAKEANFGVLYGLGSRGLAERMKVPLDEAMDFIDRYKALYPQVFEYLDEVIVNTRLNGYAETLFGRRRYFPEISAGSPMMRAAAERAAINLPVQGTAADVIKMAMINISSKFKVQSSKLSSEIRMLLQVHDELVFEVKADKVEYWAEMIKSEMENAAKLRVPLKVEAKVGSNWKEMGLLN